MEAEPPLPKLCIKKQTEASFKISWGTELSEPGGWVQKKKKKKKKQRLDGESENAKQPVSAVRAVEGLKIRISLGEPRVPEIDVQVDDNSESLTSPVKKKKRKKDRHESPLKPIKLSFVSRQWTRQDDFVPDNHSLLRETTPPVLPSPPEIALEERLLQSTTQDSSSVTETTIVETIDEPLGCPLEISAKREEDMARSLCSEPPLPGDEPAPPVTVPAPAPIVRGRKRGRGRSRGRICRTSRGRAKSTATVVEAVPESPVLPVPIVIEEKKVVEEHKKYVAIPVPRIPSPVAGGMSADFSDDDDQESQGAVDQIIMSLDEDHEQQQQEAVAAAMSTLTELPSEIPDLIPLPLSVVTSVASDVLPPISMLSVDWCASQGMDFGSGDVVPPEFPAAVTMSSESLGAEGTAIYFEDVPIHVDPQKLCGGELLAVDPVALAAEGSSEVFQTAIVSDDQSHLYDSAIVTEAPPEMLGIISETHQYESPIESSGNLFQSSENAPAVRVPTVLPSIFPRDEDDVVSSFVTPPIVCDDSLESDQDGSDGEEILASESELEDDGNVEAELDDDRPDEEEDCDRSLGSSIKTAPEEMTVVEMPRDESMEFDSFSTDMQADEAKVSVPLDDFLPTEAMVEIVESKTAEEQNSSNACEDKSDACEEADSISRDDAFAEILPNDTQESTDESKLQFIAPDHEPDDMQETSSYDKLQEKIIPQNISDDAVPKIILAPSDDDGIKHPANDDECEEESAVNAKELADPVAESVENPVSVTETHSGEAEQDPCVSDSRTANPVHGALALIRDFYCSDDDDEAENEENIDPCTTTGNADAEAVVTRVSQCDASLPVDQEEIVEPKAAEESFSEKERKSIPMVSEEEAEESFSERERESSPMVSKEAEVVSDDLLKAEEGQCVVGDVGLTSNSGTVVEESHETTVEVTRTDETELIDVRTVETVDRLYGAAEVVTPVLLSDEGAVPTESSVSQNTVESDPVRIDDSARSTVEDQENQASPTKDRSFQELSGKIAKKLSFSVRKLLGQESPDTSSEAGTPTGGTEPNSPLPNSAITSAIASSSSEMPGAKAVTVVMENTVEAVGEPKNSMPEVSPLQPSEPKPAGLEVGLASDFQAAGVGDKQNIIADHLETSVVGVDHSTDVAVNSVKQSDVPPAQVIGEHEHESNTSGKGGGFLTNEMLVGNRKLLKRSNKLKDLKFLSKIGFLENLDVLLPFPPPDTSVTLPTSLPEVSTDPSLNELTLCRKNRRKGVARRRVPVPCAAPESSESEEQVAEISSCELEIKDQNVIKDDLTDHPDEQVVNHEDPCIESNHLEVECESSPNLVSSASPDGDEGPQHAAQSSAICDTTKSLSNGDEIECEDVYETAASALLVSQVKKPKKRAQRRGLFFGQRKRSSKKKKAPLINRTSASNDETIQAEENVPIAALQADPPEIHAENEDFQIGEDGINSGAASLGVDGTFVTSQEARENDICSEITEKTECSVSDSTKGPPEASTVPENASVDYEERPVSPECDYDETTIGDVSCGTLGVEGDSDTKLPESVELEKSETEPPSALDPACEENLTINKNSASCETAELPETDSNSVADRSEDVADGAQVEDGPVEEIPIQCEAAAAVVHQGTRIRVERIPPLDSVCDENLTKTEGSASVDHADPPETDENTAVENLETIVDKGKVEDEPVEAIPIECMAASVVRGCTRKRGRRKPASERLKKVPVSEENSTEIKQSGTSDHGEFPEILHDSAVDDSKRVADEAQVEDIPVEETQVKDEVAAVVHRGPRKRSRKKSALGITNLVPASDDHFTEKEQSSSLKNAEIPEVVEDSAFDDLEAVANEIQVDDGAVEETPIEYEAAAATVVCRATRKPARRKPDPYRKRRRRGKRSPAASVKKSAIEVAHPPEESEAVPEETSAEIPENEPECESEPAELTNLAEEASPPNLHLEKMDADSDENLGGCGEIVTPEDISVDVNDEDKIDELETSGFNDGVCGPDLADVQQIEESPDTCAASEATHDGNENFGESKIEVPVEQSQDYQEPANKIVGDQENSETLDETVDNEPKPQSRKPPGRKRRGKARPLISRRSARGTALQPVVVNPSSAVLNDLPEATEQSESPNVDDVIENQPKETRTAPVEIDSPGRNTPKRRKSSAGLTEACMEAKKPKILREESTGRRSLRSNTRKSYTEDFVEEFVETSSPNPVEESFLSEDDQVEEKPESTKRPARFNLALMVKSDNMNNSSSNLETDDEIPSEQMLKNYSSEDDKPEQLEQSTEIPVISSKAEEDAEQVLPEKSEAIKRKAAVKSKENVRTKARKPQPRKQIKQSTPTSKELPIENNELSANLDEETPKKNERKPKKDTVDELSNALKFLTDSVTDMFSSPNSPDVDDPPLPPPTIPCAKEYNQEETELAVASLMGILDEEPVSQPEIALSGIGLGETDVLYGEPNSHVFDIPESETGFESMTEPARQVEPIKPKVEEFPSVVEETSRVPDEPPRKKKKKKKTKRERELEAQIARDQAEKPPPLVLKESPKSEPKSESENGISFEESDFISVDPKEAKPVNEVLPEKRSPEELTAEDLFFQTVDEGDDFTCLPALEPVKIVSDDYSSSFESQTSLCFIEPTFVKEPETVEDLKPETECEFETLQPLQAVREELMLEETLEDLPVECPKVPQVEPCRSKIEFDPCSFGAGVVLTLVQDASGVHQLIIQQPEDTQIAETVAESWTEHSTPVVDFPDEDANPASPNTAQFLRCVEDLPMSPHGVEDEELDYRFEVDRFIFRSPTPCSSDEDEEMDEEDEDMDDLEEPGGSDLILQALEGILEHDDITGTGENEPQSWIIQTVGGISENADVLQSVPMSTEVVADTVGVNTFQAEFLRQVMSEALDKQPEFFDSPADIESQLPEMDLSGDLNENPGTTRSVVTPVPVEVLREEANATISHENCQDENLEDEPCPANGLQTSTATSTVDAIADTIELVVNQQEFDGVGTDLLCSSVGDSDDHDINLSSPENAPEINDEDFKVELAGNEGDANVELCDLEVSEAYNEQLSTELDHRSESGSELPADVKLETEGEVKKCASSEVEETRVSLAINGVKKVNAWALTPTKYERVFGRSSPVNIPDPESTAAVVESVFWGFGCSFATEDKLSSTRTAVELGALGKRSVDGVTLDDELNCHEDLRSLELGRTEPEKMNLRTNCGMKMHEALECLRGSRRQRSTQADLRKPRKRSASVAGGTTRAFKIQKCSPLKRRKSGGDDIVAQKATTACSVRVEKLAVPVLDVAPRLPAIVPAPANQARENCNSVESGYDSDENSGTNSSNQGQSPSRGDLESEPVSSAEELNKSGNGDEDDVGLLKKRCDEAVRILGHVLSRMSAKRSALQNSHGLVGDLPSWIASRLASANFALNPSTSEPLSARLCSSAESVTPTTLPPKPSSTSVTSATKTSSSESKPFWTEEDLAASVQLEIVLGPSRECDLEELLVVPGLPTAMPRKRSKRLSPPAMTDACDGNKMADDDSSSCSSVSSSSQPASPMSSCQVLSVFFEVRSADADGDSSFCFQTGSL